MKWKVHACIAHNPDISLLHVSYAKTFLNSDPHVAKSNMFYGACFLFSILPTLLFKDTVNVYNVPDFPETIETILKSLIFPWQSSNISNQIPKLLYFIVLR